MDTETRIWIFKTLSDYAESQDLELRHMDATNIHDPVWMFGFYNNGKLARPYYSFEWAKIDMPAFRLVCQIIDDFEHRTDVYHVPKKGYTFNNVGVEKVAPQIKDVIFNNPATIVFWSDGTKSVVQTRDEVVPCEKCGDWYEASYEHICKQVNSYALKIDGCDEVHLVPEMWPKKNPYGERYLGWGEKNGHE